LSLLLFIQLLPPTGLYTLSLHDALPIYLGGVPEVLEVPRKSAPRPKVPMGSVGPAGKQTGIYPQDSPGGWNIIGKCPVPMFDLRSEEHTSELQSRENLVCRLLLETTNAG